MSLSESLIINKTVSIILNGISSSSMSRYININMRMSFKVNPKKSSIFEYNREF